jgi:hypothetical protein
VIIPDSAPPLALFVDWVGLRTRSFAAAKARIDGLLARSADVVCTEAELTVYEPSSRALYHRLVGVFDGTVMSGGRDLDDPAVAVTELGHTHDTVAGDAWARFGEPQRAGGWQRDDRHHIEWQWRARGPVEAPRALEAWSPFVAAHDALEIATIGSTVNLHASWELRLRDARGRVAPPEYPRTEVRAMLRKQHARASLALVLPHAAATRGFVADAAEVNEAIGLALPAKRWKLDAPRKKGGGRATKKLPEA